MYFDTHCHYDTKRFDADRDALLGEILPKAGVTTLVNVGFDIKSSRAAVGLAEKYDYIYAAVGFHPHDAKAMTDAHLAEMADLARRPKVVAIGEMGLDFHYDHSPRDVQRAVFKRQLDLAITVGLPVVVHSRESDEEVYQILEESGAGEKVGGVLHCYSSDVSLAERYIALGFYIGISGVVTYKTADELRAVVKAVPRDRLVIETDCPYLSPVPNRGKRNDSQNLRYITEKMGEILGMPAADVAAITYKNAKQLFGIK